MDDTRKVKVLKDDGPPPLPPPDAPVSIFQRLRPLIYLSGAGCLFLIAFVVMFGATWLLTPKPKPVVPGGTLAVLPVAAQSEGTEHLAAAFTDSLHAGLSSRPEFQVKALSASEGYGNDKRKLEEIGAELGVRWLVSSAVQMDGEKVSLKVDLILLDEDTQGAALSETYSRPRVVPWAAVDSAVNAIARKANISLVTGEGEAKTEVKISVPRVRPDEHAYERFLAGEWGCTRDPSFAGEVSADAKKAATGQARVQGMLAYSEAYTLDATFAEARVGHGRCALRAASEGHLADKEGKEQVKGVLAAWLAAAPTAGADPAFVELAAASGFKP